MKATFKKTILGVAVAAAMGVSAAASAEVINFSYSGMFTMLDPTGAKLTNSSITSSGPWGGGKRTNISGTMSFDTATGAGTGTVVPFSFFSSPILASATGMNMQAIGDGFGNAGTLVLGNMLFNWGGTVGIPVSIVLDAQGMFGAIQASGGPAGMTVGQVVDGTYGVYGASNGAVGGKLDMGTVAIATTTWNTTLNGAAALGNGNSGTFPLIADTIGGVPMVAGPFVGYSANFDVKTMTVTSITPSVPVPAAAWLLGSGLLGLVGVARRKAVA